MAGSGRKIFSSILSIALASMFISTAMFKLSPKFSKDIHLKFYNEYARFSKIHPAARLGYLIDPLKFMPQIGVIQLVCGILLLVGPRITKLMSCLLLSSIIVGVMYFKYILKDSIQELALFGMILLALLIRLNLFYEVEAIKENSESKKESKKDSKKEK